MNEHRYTVTEIDALRYAVKMRFLYGTTYPVPGSCSVSQSGEVEANKVVEELLRTHMLACHTAQDIYDEDKSRVMKQKSSQEL